RSPDGSGGVPPTDDDALFESGLCPTGSCPGTRGTPSLSRVCARSAAPTLGDAAERVCVAGGTPSGHGLSSGSSRSAPAPSAASRRRSLRTGRGTLCLGRGHGALALPPVCGGTGPPLADFERNDHP